MGDAGNRSLRRACCIATAIALGILAAMVAAIWLHMARRMTTDPGNARLLKVTMAPSLDAWLQSLDAPVRELDPAIVDEMQHDWPLGARFSLIGFRAPIRAMTRAAEPRGFYQVSAEELTVVAPSGQQYEGQAVAAYFGEDLVLLPTVKTKDRLLYPGGYLEVSVIVAMPPDQLPGAFGVQFRDKRFDEVELPRDGGATDVAVVWRR